MVAGRCPPAARRRQPASRPPRRGGAAGHLHLPGVVRRGHRVAAGAPRRHGIGGEPAVTVAAVQGNVPRLGLDFNAQRRAVLDNHVRETLRLAEDVRAGAAPQPQFVDLAGGLVGHRSVRQPRRRAADRPAAAGDRRADPGRHRARRPGPPAGGPGVHQHRDRLESGDRAGRPPRQGNRAAVRRVPADAVAVPASVRVRRPRRPYRAGHGQRRGAHRRGAGGRGDLLGSDLRPRAAKGGPAAAPSCWRCPPTTPPSTRR